MTKSALIIAVLCTLLLIGTFSLLNHFNANPGATLEQILAEEDLVSLHETRELFGVESEPVVVAIVSESDRPQITQLRSIETALLSSDGIAAAISFTSADLDRFAKELRFSPSPGLSMMFVTLESGSRTVQMENQIASQMETKARDSLRSGDRLIIVGTPQIRAASWKIAAADLKLILPILLLVIIAVSAICFASMTAMVLACLIASIVTLVCLVSQRLIFGEANVLVALMVPVIFSISTLDVFHLYDRTCLKSRRHSKTPARDASRELLLPCLLTSITTAGCFATLALQDTSPLLATFGIWGAAGTILAYALTFSLGTLVLSKRTFVKSRSRWLPKLTLGLVVGSQKKPLLTVILWCGVLVASLSLVSQLEVKNLFPRIFSSHVGISGDIEMLQALTGTDLNPIDILIRADDQHGRNPQALVAAILATTNFVKTLEETQLVLPVDFFSARQLEEISTRFSGNDVADAGIDDSMLSQWVQIDDGAARVQFHLAEISYARKQEVFAWLKHFDETMLSHHRLYLTGPGYFYALAEQKGLQDLLLSCTLSILLIALTMAWISRRFLITMVALSGSVMPALVITTIMVLLDIPWSIALLPLPCLLIGLMADDTIHLIWPLRGATRVRSNHYRHHFRNSAINAAPALLATTLVLASGMAALGLSGIHTNQQLGILLPFGLVIAFVYNLSLIPAVSSLLHKSSQRRSP